MAATSSGFLTVPVPRVNPKGTPVAKTADYTVTAAQAIAGTIFTNTGASGTVVFTLPAIADCAGCVVRFQVLAAQIIRCDPASSEKLWLEGSGAAGKYLNVAAVVGNVVSLYNDGTDWIVVEGYQGVLTKEA